MPTLPPCVRLPMLHGALALLVSLGTTACAGSESRAADASTGSIEGAIAYPSNPLPAMRICAISGDAHACVNTRPGQGSYRIDGLPAGDYQIFADTDSNGPSRLGGHVQAVQCIRAPCPDMPASVTVTAGARATGIDINGFYDQREDFPAMPAE